MSLDEKPVFRYDDSKARFLNLNGVARRSPPSSQASISEYARQILLGHSRVDILSEDERLDEIKRILGATVEQFESLFESARGFDESRVGNGWDPTNVRETTYMVTPMALNDALQLGESRKRSLFGLPLIRFFRIRLQEVKMLGAPKLQFVPFWVVQGYHECFFFRGSSYRINVADDVLAVEVEGRVRNLIAEEKPFRFLPEGLRRTAGKLGSLLAPKPKYFTVNDTTELARQYSEGTIYVDAYGREDVKLQEFMKSELPMREISDPEQLMMSEIGTQLVQPIETKEGVVRKLHEKIVKAPRTFIKILSNRFEVTKLSSIYVPFYIFRYRHKGRVKELRMNGFTGEVVE